MKKTRLRLLFKPSGVTDTNLSKYLDETDISGTAIYSSLIFDEITQKSHVSGPTSSKIQIKSVIKERSTENSVVIITIAEPIIVYPPSSYNCIPIDNMDGTYLHDRQHYEVQSTMMYVLPLSKFFAKEDFMIKEFLQNAESSIQSLTKAEIELFFTDVDAFMEEQLSYGNEFSCPDCIMLGVNEDLDFQVYNMESFKLEKNFYIYDSLDYCIASDEDDEETPNSDDEKIIDYNGEKDGSEPDVHLLESIKTELREMSAIFPDIKEGDLVQEVGYFKGSSHVVSKSYVITSLNNMARSIVCKDFMSSQTGFSTTTFAQASFDNIRVFSVKIR